MPSGDWRDYQAGAQMGEGGGAALIQALMRALQPQGRGMALGPSPPDQPASFQSPHEMAASRGPVSTDAEAAQRLILQRAMGVSPEPPVDLNEPIGGIVPADLTRSAESRMAEAMLPEGDEPNPMADPAAMAARAGAEGGQRAQVLPQMQTDLELAEMTRGPEASLRNAIGNSGDDYKRGQAASQGGDMRLRRMLADQIRLK